MYRAGLTSNKENRSPPKNVYGSSLKSGLSGGMHSKPTISSSGAVRVPSKVPSSAVRPATAHPSSTSSSHSNHAMARPATASSKTASSSARPREEQSQQRVAQPSAGVKTWELTDFDIGKPLGRVCVCECVCVCVVGGASGSLRATSETCTLRRR